MTLTGSFFVVELVYGVLSNSLALISDSLHMLSDLLSLIVAFTAARVSYFYAQPFSWVCFSCSNVLFVAACYSLSFKHLYCVNVWMVIWPVFQSREPNLPNMYNRVGKKNLALNATKLCTKACTMYSIHRESKQSTTHTDGGGQRLSGAWWMEYFYCQYASLSYLKASTASFPPQVCQTCFNFLDKRDPDSI